MSSKFIYSGNEFYEKTFAERAAGFTAFIVPFTLGILSASPEPYWLDSPELTAAAETLGMPHPPGHPLYVMLAKVFTLIPLGGIAFRVSLASALFGAFASFLLFKICFTLASASARSLPVWACSLISLCAAVAASTVPAWWFQCVRQEVYSLQILLMLGAFYPALLYCLSEDIKAERLLYFSAFITGLGLCNHHFIAAASLPCFIPILVNMSRYKGGFGAVKVAAELCVALMLGLLPYALLPLRAASGAAVSLGGVHSLSDLFFVVSAKVYQKSMAAQYVESFGERPLRNLTEVMGQIGILSIVAALLGFYLLLRAPRTRLAGLLLAVSAAVPLVLRLTMGLDPFRPDYQGYLLPVVALSAAGFAVFLAVTFHVFFTQFQWTKKLLPAAVAALLILPVIRARSARLEVDLSAFRTTRLFADFCLDRAAPGSLVLPSDYNLFFALWSAKFIDSSRPDLFVVNPMLLSYPGYLNATLAARPALAPLASSMLVHGTLIEPALVDAVLYQPLRVEPVLNMDDAASRYILPDGPLYRAAPQPLAESDVAAASFDSAVLWKRFYHLLGTAWQEPETRRMLLGIHYRDTLFTARRGDIEGAKQAAEAASVLNQTDPKIAALKKALAEAPDNRPLDITPFLP